jgi:hypothetical protein
MRFVWDENKNRGNKAKHGVSFEVAQRVFDDPFQLNIQDRHEAGEERWQTIGSVGGVIVLLVAHTFQAEGDIEIIRIISARKATRQERSRYEQGQ